MLQRLGMAQRSLGIRLRNDHSEFSKFSFCPGASLRSMSLPVTNFRSLSSTTNLKRPCVGVLQCLGAPLVRGRRRVKIVFSWAYFGHSESGTNLNRVENDIDLRRSMT